MLDELPMEALQERRLQGEPIPKGRGALQGTSCKKDVAVCRFVGHIMTMNPTSHLNLPDANDPKDIDRHQDAVLIRFSETFDLVDSALRDSIPKAKNIFALLGGYADRAVHAMNTR